MELAIPLVALGGLYVIQNKKQDKHNNANQKKEAFGTLYPSDISKKNPFDNQELVDSKPHTDAYFYSQNENKKNNSFYHNLNFIHLKL